MKSEELTINFKKVAKMHKRGKENNLNKLIFKTQIISCSLQGFSADFVFRCYKQDLHRDIKKKGTI